MSPRVDREAAWLDELKAASSEQRVCRRVADDPGRSDRSGCVRDDRVGGARRVGPDRHPGQQCGDRPGLDPRRPAAQSDPLLGDHAGAMEPLRRGQRDGAADDGARGRAAHAARQARPDRHRHHQPRHDAARRLCPLRRQQGGGRGGDRGDVGRPRGNRGDRQCAGAGRHDRYADHSGRARSPTAAGCCAPRSWRRRCCGWSRTPPPK